MFGGPGSTLSVIEEPLGSSGQGADRDLVRIVEMDLCAQTRCSLAGQEQVEEKRTLYSTISQYLESGDEENRFEELVNKYKLEPRHFTNKTCSLEKEIGVVSSTSASSLTKENRYNVRHQDIAEVLFQLNEDSKSANGNGVGSQNIWNGNEAAEPEPGWQKLSLHSFNITRDGLICSLSISRAGTGTFLNEGDNVALQMNFLNSVLPCKGVKVSLVKREARLGTSKNTPSSVYKETVVDSISKNTENAAVLNFGMSIPSFPGNGLNDPHSMKVSLTLNFSILLASYVM